MKSMSNSRIIDVCLLVGRHTKRKKKKQASRCNSKKGSQCIALPHSTSILCIILNQQTRSHRVHLSHITPEQPHQHDLHHATSTPHFKPPFLQKHKVIPQSSLLSLLLLLLIHDGFQWVHLFLSRFSRPHGKEHHAHSRIEKRNRVERAVVRQAVDHGVDTQTEIEKNDNDYPTNL